MAFLTFNISDEQSNGMTRRLRYRSPTFVPMHPDHGATRKATIDTEDAAFLANPITSFIRYPICFLKNRMDVCVLFVIIFEG